MCFNHVIDLNYPRTVVPRSLHISAEPYAPSCHYCHDNQSHILHQQQHPHHNHSSHQGNTTLIYAQIYQEYDKYDYLSHWITLQLYMIATCTHNLMLHFEKTYNGRNSCVISICVKGRCNTINNVGDEFLISRI